MEPAPICSVCNKTISGWEANIMVDEALFHSKRLITDMCLICKDCTNRLDKSGEGEKYHHFWELLWIKQYPTVYLASILQDYMGAEMGADRWDHQAIREIGFYVSLRLPYDEAHVFLRYLNPSEERENGPYLKRLNIAHGKDEDE